LFVCLFVCLFFYWPSGIQFFSFIQYQIRFPYLPSPVPHIHFFQVVPSLPTCDYFLLPPKWDWGVLTWSIQLADFFEFFELYLGYSLVFLSFSLLFSSFLLSFPFLSFPFLSFPFLSFPFLSFPFLSFSFLLLCFALHQLTNEYTPCMSFGVGINSLRMMFSSSIHLPAKLRMCSFLIAE
jgi:hypothetical protein